MAVIALVAIVLVVAAAQKFYLYAKLVLNLVLSAKLFRMLCSRVAFVVLQFLDAACDSTAILTHLTR